MLRQDERTDFAPKIQSNIHYNFLHYNNLDYLQDFYRLQPRKVCIRLRAQRISAALLNHIRNEGRQISLNLCQDTAKGV